MALLCSTTPAATGIWVIKSYVHVVQQNLSAFPRISFVCGCVINSYDETFIAETLQWLVEHGADVTLTCKRGLTPHAATKQCTSAVYTRKDDVLESIKIN